MALATARRRKFTGQGWRLRKDGSLLGHVTIERMVDDAGRLVGFAKITRDMTQAKLDEDRIAEAQRHDAAREHHQGLCLFDAEERLILQRRT